MLALTNQPNRRTNRNIDSLENEINIVLTYCLIKYYLGSYILFETRVIKYSCIKAELMKNAEVCF